MPVRPATIAFLWRFGASNFKAAYGRYAGDTEYSKNYLQTDKGRVRDKLAEVLGHSGNAGEYVSFEVKWPKGRLSTKFNIKDQGSDKRGEVYVTDGTKVETKRVTEPFVPGASGDPSKALIGDDRLPTASDANALLQGIKASDVRPWFMLVALAGNERALHARMILENPPAGKDHFAVGRQPAAIQDAIRTAASDAYNIFVDLSVHLRAGRIVDEIEEAFRRSPNVLLVGPPGCGKTVALEDVMALNTATAWFDTESVDPWVTDHRKVFETAFHPGYSYENFVAGLAPRAGPGINLEVKSGPLVNMAQWCRRDGREGLLVIDEFNRGPAAAIFGDTLVLLDKGKRSGREQAGSIISQPHPDRDIDVPDDYSGGDGIGVRVPKRFSIPAGLKIIGAFNSSDRSVAPLDAALLRRFSIVRVGPDPQVLAEHLELAEFNPDDTAYQGTPVHQWTPEDVRRLTVHLLIGLNDRLRAIIGEDHELGHSLFWEVPAGADLEQTTSALAAEFEEKIVGRLRLTLRDKDEQLAVILNAPEPGSAAGAGVADWIDDDSRVGRLVGPKLRVRNLKEDPTGEQIRRLLSVIQDQP